MRLDVLSAAGVACAVCSRQYPSPVAGGEKERADGRTGAREQSVKIPARGVVSSLSRSPRPISPLYRFSLYVDILLLFRYPCASERCLRCAQFSMKLVHSLPTTHTRSSFPLSRSLPLQLFPSHSLSLSPCRSLRRNRLFSCTRASRPTPVYSDGFDRDEIATYHDTIARARTSPNRDRKLTLTRHSVKGPAISPDR